MKITAMIPLSITSVLFCSLFQAKVHAQTDCDVDFSTLAANYQLTTIRKSNSIAPEYQQLRLWRRNREVAHEHPEINITKAWNLLTNDMIRPVQYFDTHQRAVEYSPGALNSGAGENSWSNKHSLISNQQKILMHLDRIEGEGCDKREYLSLTKNGIHYSLVWSVAKALPLTYKEVSASKEFRLTLSSTNANAVVVNDFFSSLASYQTTDYADIGDNESDPFLLSMINLGFVKQGASGVFGL